MPEPQQAQIRLRPATHEDCRRLWKWRNEPATREASFNTDYIQYKDHERWFSSKIEAPDTRIFIVMDANGCEVGYVRFNILADQAEISVSVDRAERGKGYGPTAIRLGSEQLLATGAAKRIVAHVKSNNPVSIGAFLRAGFTPNGSKEVAGSEAYEMVYRGTPNDAPLDRLSRS